MNPSGYLILYTFSFRFYCDDVRKSVQLRYISCQSNSFSWRFKTAHVLGFVGKKDVNTPLLSHGRLAHVLHWILSLKFSYSIFITTFYLKEFYLRDHSLYIGGMYVCRLFMYLYLLYCILDFDKFIKFCIPSCRSYPAIKCVR